jgi:hypothetical protein
VYSLAKNSFDFYVCGNADSVRIFIGANKELKWDVYFYSEIGEALQVIKNIIPTILTTVINLL